MREIRLPYGKTSKNIQLPDSNLLCVLQARESPSIAQASKIIQDALSRPIGSRPLHKLVSRGQKVAIIVSDVTRATPTAKILPPLVEELEKGGISRKEITVIFALGLHRRQREDEIKLILGDFYGKISWLEHDIDDCSLVGTTSRGTPVEVFRPVLDSDVVICTGSIEYHYYAGYTGGAKALLPGVCSRRTIDKNHSLMLEPRASPGRLDSPVRQDLEEAASLVGIDFILNVVLNSRREIIFASGGHPVLAHREGVKVIDQLCKTKVEQADIVVVSPGGYPKDINLYQAHKALENAKNAVKQGGTIILVAECRDGFGNPTFERWLKECRGKESAIERFKKGFIMGGHKAALIAAIAQKAELYLVSSLEEEKARLAYFEPAQNVQAALEMAIEKHGKDSRVLVMPYGTSTLAVV